MKMTFANHSYRTESYVFSGFWSNIVIACAIIIDSHKKAISLSASSEVRGLTEHYDTAIRKIVRELLSKNIIAPKKSVADAIHKVFTGHDVTFHEAYMAVLNEFDITIRHGNSNAKVILDKDKPYLFYQAQTEGLGV